MIFLVVQTAAVIIPSLLPVTVTVSFPPDDNCRLSDYHRLKTKILDLHDKRYVGSNVRGSHKDSMPARKQLVDIMFKRFDADSNGKIDASELSQVRTCLKVSHQSITGTELSAVSHE